MLLSKWAFNPFLEELQYKITNIIFLELPIAGNLNHPLLMFCSFLMCVCTEYGNPTNYFTRAKKTQKLTATSTVGTASEQQPPTVW